MPGSRPRPRRLRLTRPWRRALGGCHDAGEPLLQRLQAGARLLAQGNTRAAREVFADAAAQDVTDPRRQTLLALAYRAEAAGGLVLLGGACGATPGERMRARPPGGSPHR